MAKPYYETTKGLRFECTRCGRCCERPGPVFFPKDDLARAARFLGLGPAAFRRRYKLRKEDGVLALSTDGGACRFFDTTQGCTIYPARPTQCRTFPFWPEIVRRGRSWESAARTCEGINHGRKHSVTEIAKLILESKEADLPAADPW